MNLFFIIVALCFVIAHTQNDLISPTFPDMIIFFNTTPNLFHLTSSSFSLGVSIGGLLFGTISDYLGRKFTLIIGLIMLLIGCLCGMLTSSVYYLMFFRFIQGIGTAAPMVICVAMIFDYYDKNQARAITGYNNGVITFGKSIAPVIGGYLNLLMNWKLNFLLILLFTTLSISLVSIFINETSKPNTHKKYILLENLHHILKNFVVLLSDKVMVGYLFVLGFMACSLITYSIGASIVFISHLGVSKGTYGYHQGIVWAIFGIMSILNTKITKLLGIPKAKLMGFMLIIIGCVLLNFTAYIITNPYIITISMMICSGGLAILITILFADAMSLYPNIKGASSSIIAFSRTLLVTINIALAGYFFNGTIVPLTAIITILLSLTIIIYIVVIHPKICEVNK